MVNFGKFITIEGIDYTGKSTICIRLKKHLKNKYNIVLVKDPPDINPWINIKSMFEPTKKEISKISNAFLLLSARLDNYERVIKPFLGKGGVVISDRYIDSWFSYQSYMLNSYFKNVDKSINFLININKILCDLNFLSLPDLTILIDAEPTETLKRKILRKNISGYENLKIQKEIKRIYLKIYDIFTDRFKIVDSKNKNLNEVFNEVYILCKDFLDG